MHARARAYTHAPLPARLHSKLTCTTTCGHLPKQTIRTIRVPPPRARHSQGAQRKALDVLHSVGLSESVLRLIERRQRGDKWVVYGGMLGTVLVIGALWWLVKR